MPGSTGANARVIGALMCAGLAALAAASPPRNSGDASEYIALAWQLGQGRSPALSHADRSELRARFARLGPGFEGAQVDFPQIVGRDNRQDTPHFWLYPLMATPFAMVSETLAWHPARGFAALNILGLAASCALVAAHISWWVAVLLFAGPVMWWADKPMYDALVVAAVAAALAWQRRRPATAVVILALAGVQNPLLAAAWGLFAAWTLLGASRVARPRVVIAIVAGAAANLVPPAYYWVRLGVVSPLTSWTRPAVPSPGELAAFLIDPDIGVLWSAPVLVGLLMLAARPAVQAVRRNRLSIDLWFPLGILCFLLIGYAQSVNINHGGTPGPNRWAIWLLPGLVILPARAGVFSDLGRGTIAVAVAASTLFSLVNFRPSLPDRYLASSAVATWMTNTVPAVYQPPLEVFGERVSHGEPPDLPASAASCAKVVVADGWMVAPCVPPALPLEGCQLGGWCYVDRAWGLTTAHALPTPRFLWKGASNTWPAFGPVAAAIRRQLLAQPGAWTLVEPGSGSAIVRAVHDSHGVVVVRNGPTTFVVLMAPGEQPRLTVRTPIRLRTTAITLGNDGVVDQQAVQPTGESPAELVLPGGRTLGVLLVPDR